MDLYDNNLNCLQRRNPALASRVEGGIEDARVSLQATEGKAPTLIVHTEKQSCALHHPTDPLGQCQNFLHSIDAIKQSRNIALLGCGLGYPALILQQSFPNLQTLFVLEPSLSVFRTAMKSVDLTPLFEKETIHFIVGNESGVIYNTMLPVLMQLIANPLTMLDIPSITTTFPEWTENAKRQIHEVMQFGQCGLITKFKDGPLTLQNLFRNMNALIETPGISQFGTAFNGVPAIVVAAGPSLKKNIDELKTAQKEFLIIACDTVFEVLRGHGITPHIVVTVDPTELNLKHFPAEQYGPETILLFDPESRPEIVGKFPRCLTYTSDKHPFFQWLDKRLGGKGLIPKGGMISQAGIFAAHYLGCAPIVLVGQDLALEPGTGVTHDPETALCRTAKYLEGNTNQVDIPVPVPEKPFSREPLFWVEGIGGEPVPTVQNLLTYLRMMESDIKKYSMPIVDATEGGAKIAGSIVQNLKETLVSERREDVNASQIIEDSLSNSPAPSDYSSERIIEVLMKLLSEREEIALEGLNRLAHSSSESLPKLEEMLEIYRGRIFSDPVAEYLIEYGSPRELFDFLRLGPANPTEEEAHQILQERFRALLESTKIAKQRLSSPI